jgi:signal transduction histidine kinase
LSKELPDVARRAGSGLARALEDYLADWSERTGVVVEIWALPKTDVPAQVADAVLATVADAVDNVERHSGAEQVSVALTVSGSGLRLTVSDDGRGMAPGATGHGLARMRANFAALGGSLSVNGVPGGGTTVSGALPAKGA